MMIEIRTIDEKTTNIEIDMGFATVGAYYIFFGPPEKPKWA